MDKINDKLQGSSFRMLNELLYSTHSEDALVHFKDNPDDFKQVTHFIIISIIVDSKHKLANGLKILLI